MSWDHFLQSLAGHKTVDLVGPFAKNWIPSDRPVIFVDGGTKWRVPCKLGISVGDGDSGGKMDLLLKQDKDFSDLAFALHSLPQSISMVFLHGFMGERLDHQLANFGEIHAFLLTRLVPCFVLLDKEAIAWSKGTWNFKWTGRFSLFALEPTDVRVTGDCKYQLTQPAILPPLSSMGLSNEGSGEIELKTDGPFFCFYGPASGSK